MAKATPLTAAQMAPLIAHNANLVGLSIIEGQELDVSKDNILVATGKGRVGPYSVQEARAIAIVAIANLEKLHNAGKVKKLNTKLGDRIIAQYEPQFNAIVNALARGNQTDAQWEASKGNAIVALANMATQPVVFRKQPQFDMVRPLVDAVIEGTAVDEIAPYEAVQAVTVYRDALKQSREQFLKDRKPLKIEVSADIPVDWSVREQREAVFESYLEHLNEFLAQQRLLRNEAQEQEEQDADAAQEVVLRAERASSVDSTDSQASSASETSAEAASSAAVAASAPRARAASVPPGLRV